MDHNVMTADSFARTAAALLAYDNESPLIDLLFEQAITDADVAVAEQKDREAKAKIGEAFYLDTADRNSRENCLLVPEWHLPWLRAVVQSWQDGKRKKASDRVKRQTPK